MNAVTKAAVLAELDRAQYWLSEIRKDVEAGRVSLLRPGSVERQSVEIGLTLAESYSHGAIAVTHTDGSVSYKRTAVNPA